MYLAIQLLPATVTTKIIVVSVLSRSFVNIEWVVVLCSQRGIMAEMDIRRITFLVLHKCEFPKYFTYRIRSQVSRLRLDRWDDLHRS